MKVSVRHVEIEVNNKHLIVESCWFFSLHTLLTMHGHRNLKLLACSKSGNYAMTVTVVHLWLHAPSFRRTLAVVRIIFVRLFQ
jgi:hypothetical protein